MKVICSKDKCTGCGLCVSICPQQCVSLKVGLLGHLYPIVDKEKCVDCNLCKKKCPSNSEQFKSYPLQAFAAWSSDEEDYKTSTSGGAASVLSRYIISQGGVVYGCAMLPNVEVRHIRVDSQQELSLLKGSKYVQSSIVDIIPLVKRDVKDGKKVLFVGTPCQVAAIKNLFIKQPENLFLVDLICHGVPSLKFLKDHVKRNANNMESTRVIFRDSARYVFSIVQREEIVYKRYLKEQRYKDLYINAFFDCFSHRDSCFNCQYACPERISDMTIGDFWKLGKYRPAGEIPKHNEGCSVMLPISAKGIYLIEKVTKDMHLYWREVWEAVKGNDQLQKPKHKNIRIRIFQIVQSIVDFPQMYYLLVIDKIIIRYIKKVVVNLNKLL